MPSRSSSRTPCSPSGSQTSGLRSPRRQQRSVTAEVPRKPAWLRERLLYCVGVGRRFAPSTSGQRGDWRQRITTVFGLPASSLLER
jgi:hypothetical protein